MRVVAGALRSRPLRAPKGDVTRPTSDRVRESLFAVIGDVEGLVVLDLYAGSGALAIEALSRGATRAVCVETNRSALATIAENVQALGLRERLRVIARRVGDAHKHIVEAGPFDLVLIDPPYADVPSGALVRELTGVVQHARTMLSDGALLVIEHATRDAPPQLDDFNMESTRRWGDTSASFYRLVAL